MHTKGPWERVPTRMEVGSDHGILINSSNGEHIAAALDLHPFNRDNEIEANARLIAAAPELLEALDGTVQFMKLTGIKVPKDIDHILAKAKGL